MTWEEALDQTAVSYCYSRWSDIDWYALDQIHEVTQPPYMEELCIKQAAELYARSKWDEACNAQKELCEVAIWPACVEGLHHVEILSKSEEAIKKCPKPEFKP